MDTDFSGKHDMIQNYGLGDSNDEYLVGDRDGDGKDNFAVRFDKVSTWSLRAFSMAILASIACFNFLSTALEFSDT